MRMLTNIRAVDVLDELEAYEEEEAISLRQANAVLRRRRIAKASAHGTTATEAARKVPMANGSARLTEEAPVANGSARLDQVSRAARPAPQPDVRTVKTPSPAPEPVVTPTPDPTQEPVPEPAPSPTLLTPEQLADYLTDLARQRRTIHPESNPRAEARRYIQEARKCECLDPACLTIRSLSRKQLDLVVTNVRG